MALRSWIHKKERIATATVATPATVRPVYESGVAKVAGVAVAEPQKQKIILRSGERPTPKKSVDQSTDQPDQLATTPKSAPGDLTQCRGCGAKTMWTWNGEPLCPDCQAKEPPSENKATNAGGFHRCTCGGTMHTDSAGRHVCATCRRFRQVVCRAFEHNGCMMSTSSKHCREWRGDYCRGCTLSTVQ